MPVPSECRQLSLPTKSLEPTSVDVHFTADYFSLMSPFRKGVREFLSEAVFKGQSDFTREHLGKRLQPKDLNKGYDLWSQFIDTTHNYLLNIN